MKRAERQALAESLKAEQLRFAEELSQFADQRWPRFEAEAQASFDHNYYRVANDRQLFAAWALFHDRQRGRTVLEEYLANRDAALSPLGFAIVSAELAAWISYLHVLDVNERRGLHVQDLLTSQRCWVEDSAAAATLRPGYVLCGRVARTDRVNLFGGVFPVALPRKSSVVSGLVAVGREYYGRTGGDVRPATLRAAGEPLAILNCWRMGVGLLRPPDPLQAGVAA